MNLSSLNKEMVKELRDLRQQLDKYKIHPLEYAASITLYSDIDKYISDNPDLISQIYNDLPFLTPEMELHIGLICFALNLNDDGERAEMLDNYYLERKNEQLSTLELLEADDILLEILKIDESHFKSILKEYRNDVGVPKKLYQNANTYLDCKIYGFTIRADEEGIIRARQIDILVHLFRKFNYFGYNDDNPDSYTLKKYFKSAEDKRGYIIDKFTK